MGRERVCRMDPRRPESNFWVTVGTKELEVLNSAINQLGNQESPIFSGISIAFGEPYYLLLGSSGPKIPRSIPPKNALSDLGMLATMGVESSGEDVL